MAKPVFEKLEIHKHKRIVVLNSPSEYNELVEILDPGFYFSSKLEKNESFIHYFAAIKRNWNGISRC